MVPWWYALITYALGLVMGLGLVIVPFWVAGRQESSRISEEIDAANAELRARIKGGCRQRVAQEEPK